MNAKMIFCTDDNDMADTVPMLFGEFVNVRLIRKDDLRRHKKILFHYDHFVLGIAVPEESDWRLCQSIINEGFSSVYLMIRSLPSADDRKRAKEIGIKDILLDPLSKVWNIADSEEDIFSMLKALPGEDVNSKDRNLIDLGRDIYLHTKQFWVGSERAHHQLTALEIKLIKMFVENEGVVLTKDEIAEEIWDSKVEISSVRRLVKRLREKLGPAGELIVGRKQGGYIYRKDR
jgi:DNA-binding response OmpR family regulator